VPYSLPAVGAAVAIGTNTAASIKPGGISAFNWAYTLFNAYGTGSFNPDFSSAGAFAIAGSGGHNAPPNLDAAVFDFSTASWKLVANANGIASRDSDYTAAEASDNNYRELLAQKTGQIPAPSHLYGLTSYLPASMGGGPKGSYIKLGSTAALTNAAFGRGIHKMDLSTGMWTRLTGDLADFMWAYESTAVFDPVDKRYYIIPDSFHRVNYLQYYDVATATIKQTTSYPWPADYTASEYQTTWLDPARRLILNQRPGWPLRALDLTNISAGWVVLNTTGSQPNASNRWAFYEPDGKFYTHANNDGQTIRRLTPPANWKTGTWTYDTVTVSGAALPNYTNAAGNSTRHYGTFFYVSAIKSLAWVSGESTQVIVLRPPATN